MSYQSNAMDIKPMFHSLMSSERLNLATGRLYYKNCYLTLKSQRTIFENLQPDLTALVARNRSDRDAIMHFKAMLPTVLDLTYSQIFTYYPFAIPEIRLVMKPDLSPEIESFATKLLNSFLALIRFENRLSIQVADQKQMYSNPPIETDPFTQLNEIQLQTKTVMCHICENLIPANLISQHMKNCELVYKTREALMTTDERLKEVLQTEEKAHLQVPWPGKEEEAVNRLLPIVQVISMIKNAIKVETNQSDAITVLSSIIDTLMTIDLINNDTDLKILCANASRLIRQKLKTALKFAEAMDLAQRTRVTKSVVEPSFVVNIAEFTFVKRISNGAYARVFLATKESLNSPVAIKVIPRSDLSTKNSTKRILTEKDIMLHFNSPFTIKFFYSTIGKHNLYMVMEYLPGGDLFSLLEKYGCFGEAVAKNYTAQIVAALDYLRQKYVIHRDLKPDNILLDSAGHLKLVDFGLSYFGMVGRQTDIRETSMFGTPDYIAPEIIMLENHSYQADYWSLGAMLYEFITGVTPFHDNTPQEIFSNVLCGVVNVSELKEMEASPECIDLILKLLVLDPKKRLGANSIDEIKNHPWFKDIDWEHLDQMPAPFIPEIKDDFDTSNFEAKHVLNAVDDSDILEDIQLGTDTVEIADCDFDSRFVSKSITTLGKTTVEDAMQIAPEHQIFIPRRNPTFIQKKKPRLASIHHRQNSAEIPHVPLIIK